MGKTKSFLCYFPPEVIGEIGIFKNLMGMSSGEFLMQAIAEWKKNHENLVQTAMQINDLKIAAEKPKSEQKPAEKVQEPKDEPKASEKPKNAPKKVKPKAFLCYLPPKVIDHIDQYKKLFHMSYGDFMAEAVAAWEAQHKKYAQAVAQWDSIREKAEADEYEISKQGK